MQEIIAINQDVSFPGSFNVTDSHTYCKNLEGGAIALAGAPCLCDGGGRGGRMIPGRAISEPASCSLPSAGLHQTSLGPPTNITLSPAATATSSRLSDCLLLGVHEGVTAWKFRDVLRGTDLPGGAAIECLAAQPGACLVTATPVASSELALEG